MAKPLQDLTGRKFGRLTVTRMAPEYRTPRDNHKFTRWYCDCECGTKDKIIMGICLLKGITKSCGCLQREYYKQLNIKYNKYDITSHDYGIGWTSNTNEEFYFDLEDYDKIKDYCWIKDKTYIKAKIKGTNKFIFLHKLVMGDLDNKYVIDHIDTLNHNDNRKCNLRIVTHSQNSANKKISPLNKSGVVGVHWNKERKKWVANIVINYKRKICYCDSFEEAVKKRKEFEEQYQGEHSYSNSQKIAQQYKLKEEEVNNG